MIVSLQTLRPDSQLRDDMASVNKSPHSGKSQSNLSHLCCHVLETKSRVSSRFVEADKGSGHIICRVIGSD